MINLNNIKITGNDCCGCDACEQICPKNCIKLEPNKEGFLYPIVDEKFCIECGACIKHCPVLSENNCSETKKVYAAKIKDDEALFRSTSGGVFSQLALNILKKGGVVFGCAYDANLTAHHICVDTPKNIKLLQNSKYVQSDIRGIYTQVKNELKADRYVLFSGTGCQTAGLKSFLGKTYNKLLTVDIVCHGVPSPKLFKYYLEWLGNKMGGKITYFNFRSKKDHGWQHFFQADTETKSKTTYGMFDPYYNAFIKSKTIRESCYSCKFSNKSRPGDITLGDYWGIEFAHPDFYSSKGVSLVLVNTEKGIEYWKAISNTLDCIESDFEKATVLNSNLVSKPERPACRDTIYDGIDDDFDEFIKNNLKFKVNPLKRIIMLIPSDIKVKLKRLKK